jgi:phospholipase C
MTELNRRRFLQLTGGTAAFTLLPESIARAAEIPARHRTGTIKDVEHIVVLMQENRSFDHYFGTMRGVRGFGDPRPVVLPSGKTVWHQSDGTKDVLPFHPDAADLGLQFLRDLNHDWAGTQKAFNGGRYDQWIPAKTATTMAYMTRDDIPFHYALADAFTICDGYHCSFMGSTDPNRYYMWTGFTGNDGKGGGPVLGNDEAGYDWTTYPERLERAGVSWKIYQDVGDGLTAAGSWGWTSDPYIGNYGDNSLLYFHQYQNARPGDPLHEKAVTGTSFKTGQGYFDLLKADVTGGKLPAVSWVVAPEAYTEHPNWPVNYGAWYIAQVLDALTADPEVWSKTVLLITYDENDGFFDHVVPPYAVQGKSTVDITGELYPGDTAHVAGPYGLGQRVPMLAVSPWSKGGWVNSQVFDHTSIIRFIERRFGVQEPNISPWRRTVCGDLTSAFDFRHPNARVAALPSTTAYVPPDRNRHPSYTPAPPANPALPTQERGSRPARALPYRLTADAAVTAGRLRLSFTAGHGAGASFYVTSTTRTDGPWSYTVESGKSLTDEVATGPYDFSVFGPNGFHCRFTGDTTATEPAVTFHPDHLILANPGRNPVTLKIANAYTGKSRTQTLKPGAHQTYDLDHRQGHTWYDVTITTGPYLRRYAGHRETGHPSTSDPALAPT